MKWIRLDESDHRDKSHITQRDKERLMDMVLSFGWDCWQDGDHMYSWEDAVTSNWLHRIADMLEDMS